jgi:hypothetical protein
LVVDAAGSPGSCSSRLPSSRRAGCRSDLYHRRWAGAGLRHVHRAGFRGSSGSAPPRVLGLTAISSRTTTSSRGRPTVSDFSRPAEASIGARRPGLACSTRPALALAVPPLPTRERRRRKHPGGSTRTGGRVCVTSSGKPAFSPGAQRSDISQSRSASERPGDELHGRHGDPRRSAGDALGRIAGGALPARPPWDGKEDRPDQGPDRRLRHAAPRGPRRPDLGRNPGRTARDRRAGGLGPPAARARVYAAGRTSQPADRIAPRIFRRKAGVHQRGPAEVPGGPAAARILRR